MPIRRLSTVRDNLCVDMCGCVAFSEHYDRLFKEFQLKVQCEPATGLLLIFPHHCVHVLEVALVVFQPSRRTVYNLRAIKN